MPFSYCIRHRLLHRYAYWCMQSVLFSYILDRGLTNPGLSLIVVNALNHMCSEFARLLRVLRNDEKLFSDSLAAQHFITIQLGRWRLNKKIG